MSKLLKMSCTILFVLGILLVSFLWANGDKHEKRWNKVKKRTGQHLLMHRTV